MKIRFLLTILLVSFMLTANAQKGKTLSSTTSERRGL